MERYQQHYSWGDPDILRDVLRKFGDGHLCAVDVACGPNVVVYEALLDRDASFIYVAVDIDPYHLGLQRCAAGNAHAYRVCASSSCLPLKTGSVDLFIFHHAIDDILETEGMAGIELSLQASLRVTRNGGLIIFSHCVFESDEFTKKVSLADVEEILAKTGRFGLEKRSGRQQDWLIVKI